MTVAATELALLAGADRVEGTLWLISFSFLVGFIIFIADKHTSRALNI